MKRNPDSHKGDNGKVVVVGGSRWIHGAPIFSALAAEASGVDLIYVCLPDWHENVAKEASLNFQVHPFEGEDLKDEHRESILKLLATMDSAVIGPGIGRDAGTIRVLLDLIDSASCPLVLDATALQPKTLSLMRGKKTIVTPHLGELERMGIDPKDIGNVAKEFGTTIVLKASVLQVASPDGKVTPVAGGNAGLTVGGTGDTLAGLIAGLIAQNVNHRDACIAAATIIKRAATALYHEKGYAFTTRDVLSQIPHLLHTYGNFS